MVSIEFLFDETAAVTERMPEKISIWKSLGCTTGSSKKHVDMHIHKIFYWKKILKREFLRRTGHYLSPGGIT